MSRFDKLEPEHQPAPESKSELERFKETPVQRTHAEGWDPAKNEGLGPTSLERFTSDGTDAARVATDELDRLPTLECAGCHGEVGKYERRCPACGAPLDSPEALELNRRRAAEQRQRLADAQRRTEEAAAEQRAVQKAEAESLRRNAVLLAREVRDHYDAPNPQNVFALILFGLGLLGLALFVKGTVATALLIAGGLTCLGASLPRDTRAWLLFVITRGRYGRE